MTKELYLDSAHIPEIKRYSKIPFITGITTNPSLMSKEGKGDYLKKIKEIVDIVEKNERRLHLSVEVTVPHPMSSLDREPMKAQALAISNEFSESEIDLAIKIPFMDSTLDLIAELKDEGVQVNATACMMAHQGILAAMAGADFVSFFYNRMLDAQIDALDELALYGKLVDGSVKTICGSIRKPSDVLACWNVEGIDIVTASARVIGEMVHHSATMEAVEKFEKDFAQWLK